MHVNDVNHVDKYITVSKMIVRGRKESVSILLINIFSKKTDGKHIYSDTVCVCFQYTLTNASCSFNVKGLFLTMTCGF